MTMKLMEKLMKKKKNEVSHQRNITNAGNNYQLLQWPCVTVT